MLLFFHNTLKKVGVAEDSCLYSDRHKSHQESILKGGLLFNKPEEGKRLYLFYTLASNNLVPCGMTSV